jgi:hypothetical protein
MDTRQKNLCKLNRDLKSQLALAVDCEAKVHPMDRRELEENILQ